MTMQTAAANGLGSAALAVDDSRADRAINVFASFDSFTSAWRMAGALSSSTIVPKAYQGEDGRANCMIAIELASRIGASVFMVMQSLDVIQGRPSWSSKFLIGTVNSSRRFSPLRFKFTGTPGKDDWGCRAYARDLASGDSEPLMGTEITIGIAKLEGWYDRSGSKWKTIPEQMLQYRAAAFWTRVYCPEIGLGLLTTEEAADLPPDLPAVTSSTPAALEQAILAQPSPLPSVVTQAASSSAAPKAVPPPEEAKAPAPVQPAPAAAKPTASHPRGGRKPEPEPPFGSSGQAPAPRVPLSVPVDASKSPHVLVCAVCSKQVTGAGVATLRPDGTTGIRHTECSPFAPATSEPTDGEPPPDYQSDADEGGR